MTRNLVLLALLLALVGCGGRTVVWQKNIDLNGGDERACALVTDGASLIVAGTATSPQNNRTVWLLQRLSTDGKEVWTRLYSEGQNCVCGGIAAEPGAGDIYAAGRCDQNGRTVCVVVKYAANGTIVWQKGLAVGDKTWGTGVCRVGDDKLAVCGLAGTDANSDYMVALLSARDGSTAWVRNYDLCPTDLATAIAADAKGNLAVIGERSSGDQTDVVVMKLGPGGDTLWTRTYDSGGDDDAGGVAFDPFGNVLVTATARSCDSTRCVILEYDPDGGVIRKAAYGPDAQATGKGVCITPESDIFVTGSLISAGKGAAKTGSEVLAFQYKPSAMSIWERHHPAGPNSAGVGIVVAGDVYIAATVEGKSSDIAVMRFSRPVMPKK